VEDRGKYTWLEIVLTEGKNREVRRLLEAVGLSVLKLVRTRIGPCTLAGLKSANGATFSLRRSRSFMSGKTQGPANPEALRVPPAKDSKLVGRRGATPESASIVNGNLAEHEQNVEGTALPFSRAGANRPAEITLLKLFRKL